MPRLRQIDHPGAEGGLVDRVLAVPLAGIDPRGLGAREIEDPVVDQRIVQDRVRLLQRAQGVDGQVAWIARPGADQPYGAGLEDRAPVQHGFQPGADHRPGRPG